MSHRSGARHARAYWGGPSRAVESAGPVRRARIAMHGKSGRAGEGRRALGLMARGRRTGIFCEVTTDVVPADFAHKLCGDYPVCAPPLLGSRRFPQDPTRSLIAEPCRGRPNNGRTRYSLRFPFASRQIVRRAGASHRRLPLSVPPQILSRIALGGKGNPCHSPRGIGRSSPAPPPPAADGGEACEPGAHRRSGRRRSGRGLTTFAPILISFSMSVVRDHSLIGSGVARARRNLPRLEASA